MYPDGWVPTAKTLAMAMLQPVHPIVRRAGIYRSNRPYKLKSIRHVLTELRYLAEWAARAGLTADLSAWTHADGDAYLAERKARSFSAGRSANDLLRHLGDFRGSCPTADFPSRSARGLQDPAAKSRLPSSRRKPSGHWYAPAGPTSTRSPPISPLLATKLRSSIRVDPKPGGPSSTRDIDDALDAWLSSPQAFVPLHIYTLGRARAGDINWDGLGLCTALRLSGTNFTATADLLGNFASIRRSAKACPSIRLQLGPTRGC